jgi:hypothetical protein
MHSECDEPKTVGLQVRSEHAGLGRFLMQKSGTEEVSAGQAKILNPEPVIGRLLLWATGRRRVRQADWRLRQRWRVSGLSRAQANVPVKSTYAVCWD